MVSASIFLQMTESYSLLFYFYWVDNTPLCVYDIFSFLFIHSYTSRKIQWHRNSGERHWIRMWGCRYCMLPPIPLGVYLGAVWLDHMVVSFSVNYHTELIVVRLICVPCQCWIKVPHPPVFLPALCVWWFSLWQSPLTVLSWNLNVVLMNILFPAANILNNLYWPGGFLHLKGLLFVCPFTHYVVILVFYVWVQYRF